jgi:hypothetical protein
MAELRSCAHCGEADVKLRKCSTCREVRYCSEEHQKEHWEEHRKPCDLAAGGAFAEIVYMTPDARDAGTSRHRVVRRFLTMERAFQDERTWRLAVTEGMHATVLLESVGNDMGVFYVASMVSRAFAFLTRANSCDAAVAWGQPAIGSLAGSSTLARAHVSFWRFKLEDTLASLGIAEDAGAPLHLAMFAHGFVDRYGRRVSKRATEIVAQEPAPTWTDLLPELRDAAICAAADVAKKRRRSNDAAHVKAFMKTVEDMRNYNKDNAIPAFDFVDFLAEVERPLAMISSVYQRVKLGRMVAVMYASAASLPSVKPVMRTFYLARARRHCLEAVRLDPHNKTEPAYPQSACRVKLARASEDLDDLLANVWDKFPDELVASAKSKTSM